MIDQVRSLFDGGKKGFDRVGICVNRLFTEGINAETVFGMTRIIENIDRALTYRKRGERVRQNARCQFAGAEQCHTVGDLRYGNGLDLIGGQTFSLQ